MLIGRDEELREAVARLAARSLVLVTGEAGAGKTALLRAAADQHRGRAFYGGGMPMLRSQPGLPIERALGRSLPRADAPALASLAGAVVGDGVLVLDDLQWADELTLAALPSLASRVRLAVAVRSGPAVAPILMRLVQTEGIELGPLPVEHATELVRRARPALSSVEAREIARRSGGNPLLLQELASAPAGTPSLRLSLAARLAELHPDARTALLRLILLARPAEPHLLGPGASELVESGLAVAQDGTIALRHALLGDTVLEEMDAAARRRAHADLARLVADPGEAARHHAEAGERAAARERALQAAGAATRPFERAAHLGVAALASEGPDADDLRLRAAEQLFEAGEFALSARAARAVEGTGHVTRARRALVLARALMDLGEHAEADAEIADGLRLVEGVEGDLEARLLLQRALRRVEDWDQDALDDVLAARALLTGADTEADLVLGKALYVRGDIEGALGALLAGQERAVREGEARLAVDASIGRAAVEVWRKDKLAAGAHLSRAEQLAQEYGAGRRLAWVLSFRGHLQTWQFGEYGAALATHAAALADPDALGLGLYRTLGNQAVVLADLGHDREAIALLERAARGATTDDARAWTAWLHGDADWLAGRMRQAAGRLEVAQAALREGPLPLFVQASLAWVAFELEVPPARPALERGAEAVDGFSMVDAAVRALATEGDGARAPALFLAAADAFAELSVRDRLRATWGAGEAARRTGDLARAREILLDLERELAQREHVPLLARTRRSLRLAGVRSGAARGPRRGALTHRESEVLGLVGAGWTSAEIAARLALSPATVESHVRSARRKLGTRSRVTAVHAATGGDVDDAERAPLVVVPDARHVAAVAAELRDADWRTIPGWHVPVTEWRVDGERIVCHGEVRAEADAEAALRVAVRGAGIVAALDERAPFAAAFVESLRRLGAVRFRDAEAAIAPELRRVLALVAGGATVAEIAVQTHQSPRTVKRRLAAARAALGARTTAEAIRLIGAG